ncbi:MAG TPA: beta-galactosidase [Rhodothermales bacterium]|nr:beta-galactosidase [Rhodothermales bacterium]
MLAACDANRGSLVGPEGSGTRHNGGISANGKPGGDGPPPNVTKPISFSILEDYDKGEDLNSIAQDFQLFNELEVNTWRGSFGWDDYEPSQGTYDFTWLNDFANLAAQYNISLRPYLGYTAPWAAIGGSDGIYWNDPPANLQDWTNFVANLSADLSSHSNVLSYEIYNEENDTFWWEGSMAQYNDVLRAASDAIHINDPDAQVILGGFVFPEYEWINGTCTTYQNAGAFDIAPFHAYPETWSRNNVTVESYLDAQYHDWYVPSVQNDCGGKPIWINETGFAAPYNGTTEQDQANWWVRAFATFLADPNIEHLGIYEIKDLDPSSGAIGDSTNYHLGLTYADRTKKLAFYTVDMLTDLFNVGTITTADGELTKSGRSRGFNGHLFKRPDGSQILIVYDVSSSATVDLTVQTPGTSVTEYALNGSSSTYSNFDGTTLHGVALTEGNPRVFLIQP